MWCCAWRVFQPSFLPWSFLGSVLGEVMLIELLTDKYPGMRFWLTQRLTALVMAAYFVLMGVLLLTMRPDGFESWRNFMSPIWLRCTTLLFFASLCTHAWLGVRDVLRDYIFDGLLRQYLQVFVDILLVIYFVWMSVILWKL